MMSTSTFSLSSEMRPTTSSASLPSNRRSSRPSSATASSKRKMTPASAEAETTAADGEEMCSEDISVKRKAMTTVWDEEEEDPYVVLCALWGGGMLGAAYYLVETGHLYIMPDAAEREDFGLLRRVLLQVQPRVILASARIDDHMQKVLTDYIHSPVSGGTGKETVAQIELLPSGDFRVESCRQRLLSGARLPGVNPEGSPEEKLIQVSSLLPLEAVNLVRSVGALLKYIERKRLGVELEDEEVKVPIIAVKHFSLDNLLVMDESSYSALQIFQKEYHPSVYKTGKSGTKEGLSLFGIVNRSRSSLGTKLLKLWFLRPLADIEALRQRQEAVEFLMSPSHEETTMNLHDCSKHIKNIPRILAKMNAAKVSMTDWQSLYKCAYNGIYIGDICNSQPKTINIFNKISNEFSEDLHRIASLITKVVDFEESSVQQRFCVKPHVDEELDKLKELYNGLPDLLTQVAHEELEKLPRIAECNITYLPQLGYLLVVAKTEVEQNEQWLADMGLSLVFETDNLAHFKSDRMRELDNALGDTQCEIQDHETAIMHRLQEVILEHSTALLTVVELVAELDCLICLALFAREHNCIKPELTDENVILIKKGRHPLQEMAVSSFVPNDTALDLKHGRMKIMTGPNASGKSIYLKQVGLIVFLAHIGSFVPAEAAKIGMVDHIFTRIQTRESVSVGLSSFMIDLNQVAAALNGATQRSLVLLDEFGKGTGTRDGISLLVGSLLCWLEKEEECPNVLVSTHFHSIIQQKLLPESSLIEYLTMETLQDKDELVFLYQLIPGHCDSSHACHIASLAGVPSEVVQRGVQVIDLIQRNEPITRLDSPSMEEKMRVCELIVARFMELDLENDDLEAFLKDFVLPTAKDIL